MKTQSMSPPVRDINSPFRVPSGTPPFTKADLKAAIPAHCFERSNFKSFMYLFLNAFVAAALYIGALYIPNDHFLGFLLWPLYWFLQGNAGTGLWVIAHECGHRAFSSSVLICDVVGLTLHSFLTVPYHSWRISHAKHHRSTGDIDRDEVFVPKKLSQIDGNVEAAKKKLNPVVVFIAMIGFIVVGWYAHLWFHVTGRDYGRYTNHYNPRSPLFNERQFWDVVISDVALLVVFACLGFWAYQTSVMTVVFFYGIPIIQTNFWLLLYTFLHHTDPAVPHYRSESWNWLQGALTTVDRDYGFFFNTVHHNIGNTHVLHHLFSAIPHYHAKEASAALKPILGDFYFENKDSIISSLWNIANTCRYVDDRPEQKILWFVDKDTKE